MADNVQTGTAGLRPKRTTLQAMAVFFERRSLVMLGLGFAAGLPNLLIFDTLSAWLREAGLSLEVIGFFALATLSYSLKFIWAPLVDRTSIPLLTPILGHRRSWMLLTQVVMIAGLWMIAGTDPGQSLWRVAVFAVIVGLFGATQDIVIDAWRIEAAPADRQGAMAATYQWGYRIAIIVAGAVPLILAELYNWNFSYGVMAALMGIGVASALLAPREIQHAIRPIPVGDIPKRPVLEPIEWAVRLALIALAALIIGSGLTGSLNLLSGLFGLIGVSLSGLEPAWTAKPGGVYVQLATVVTGFVLLVVACWPIPRFDTRPGAYLAGSFGSPVADFFKRFGGLAGVILALICVYRLADFVLNIMNPFYLDLGFTKLEIAEVRKVFGVAASMVGVFIGGLSVARLGLIRTMVIGAFMSPVSNLVFAWLAVRGHDVGALYLAISIDNSATGYAGTALIAYMSSLTSAGFTATQYALFSSLYALPGKLIASQSGRLVEAWARSADAGGVISSLKSLFADMEPGTFAAGSKTAQVTPAALGAGYVTFFLYSAAIGVFAIVLAFIVASRHARLLAQTNPPEEPASGTAPP
jgi:MFS transporter, PAT family, beta-lactamase induction signal transducer AmpG